jgi:hypothetical protein
MTGLLIRAIKRLCRRLTEGGVRSEAIEEPAAANRSTICR